MQSFLETYHLLGLAIGLATFLVIGAFHPLVIKGEYHFGQRCRVWFFAAGIVAGVLSWSVDDLFWSCLFGVTAFSCMWSILEVRDQARRVAKGWFPANPKRAGTKNQVGDSVKKS